MRKGDENFHHSMLIHTKETKKTMHGLLDTVKPFVLKLRQAIQSKGIGRDSYKLMFSELQEYYDKEKKNVLDCNQHVPDFIELSGKLWEYFSDFQCESFPEVLEISSDQEKGDDLNYPEDEPYAVIAIGGNRLARGFTLEGLHTSYFVREPKELKSDTLLQQGRWFGFRGKNEDLVRIFTTESLRDEFWALKSIENDLHDTIRHFETCGLDTEEYAVPILKALNQIPTSKDKVPIPAKIVNSMFPGDYLPKRGSGFPIGLKLDIQDHQKRNQRNLDSIGNFIDVLCNENGMPNRSIEGHYEFKDVPLKHVIELFESSLDNFIEDPYNRQGLLEYLSTRGKMGQECSNWTVAVMGNQPSKNDKIINFGSSDKEFTLNLVQRTRTARGSNDFGVFLPQTPHFAIGMNYTEGETIKQILARRDKKNPILLIYLIDKDSEPNKQHNSNRAKLGTKDHIAAFAIGLPLATLTSEERKKFNVEVWHNSRLKLEVKAE